MDLIRVWSQDWRRPRYGKSFCTCTMLGSSHDCQEGETKQDSDKSLREIVARCTWRVTRPGESKSHSRRLGIRCRLARQLARSVDGLVLEHRQRQNENVANEQSENVAF
jgi:hypothetical protein